MVENNPFLVVFVGNVVIKRGVFGDKCSVLDDKCSVLNDKYGNNVVFVAIVW